MKISNRVFWAGTLLACSALLSPSLSSQPAGTRTITVPVFARDVIDTQLLRIVDNRGNVRAQIGTRADGTPYSVGLNEDILRAVEGLRASQAAQGSVLAASPSRAAVSAPAPGAPSGSPEVYVMVQELVKTRLKTPATARFAPISEVTINETHPGIRWIVTGWVDSQNELGGTARLQFTATVRHPFGAPWTLDNLTLQQQR